MKEEKRIFMDVESEEWKNKMKKINKDLDNKYGKNRINSFSDDIIYRPSFYPNNSRRK